MHQLDLFLDRPASSCRPIGPEELFDAYAACRRNKRRSASALAFELEYEEKLLGLLEAINSGQWRTGRAVAFIVERPVKREIFAAPFSDRVVHHLLFNKLNPLFEKAFISELVPVVRRYLDERLGLGLHPGKIVLAPCSEGVGFLGAVIKPYRTIIADTTGGCA